MIRAAIRTHLLVDSPLTALIGQRVYWNRLPQSDTPYELFPCVIFRRSTGGYGHDLDGSDGYAAPTFQFMVPNLDSEVTEQVAEALIDRLIGFRGTMGTIEVQRLTVDDERDAFYESDEDPDKGFHQIEIDATIGYVRSIPTF